MNRKTALLLCSAFFLLIFAALSKFEDRSFLRNFDFAATVRVQDAVAKVCASRCDGLIEDIGFFASPLFSSGVVFLVTLLMALDYKKRKIRLRALWIPVLFTFVVLAEIYGKSIVRHPAPPFFMLKNPTTIFPTYHVFEQFSYPSGHAARAVFLSFLLFPFVQKIRGGVVLLMVYAGVVMLGKIYLGQHWASDVVGGALLGAGFGLGIWLLTNLNKSHIMHKQ